MSIENIEEVSEEYGKEILRDLGVSVELLSFVAIGVS